MSERYIMTENGIYDESSHRRFSTYQEIVDELNNKEDEIKRLADLGQELYEWDSKRCLNILTVMTGFSKQYSQDSKEYQLLCDVGDKLPINANLLYPKEAYKEDK